MSVNFSLKQRFRQINWFLISMFYIRTTYLEVERLANAAFDALIMRHVPMPPTIMRLLLISLALFLTVIDFKALNDSPLTISGISFFLTINDS